MTAHAGPASDDGSWFAVNDSSAAGGLRRAAMALGQRIGLGESTLADLAIVATELGTNLARHAVEGTVLVRSCRDGQAVGVELVAVDRGPGMADAALSGRDGESTAGTLGIGLGAIARKSRSFDVYSRVGVGTVLAVTVGSVPLGLEAGVRRPITGEQVCGDGYGSRLIDGRRQLMLCDGLGHGPLANLASQAALVEFARAPAAGPRDVLEYIHERTRHTRGVVAGIAELDPSRGIVRFAGIGNIAASVTTPSLANGGARRAMVSMPGIVGQQRLQLREFEHALAPAALVILHSDGLTDRWSLDTYPGLVERSPVVIAATLLRDAGTRRDDAAALVAKS